MSVIFKGSATLWLSGPEVVPTSTPSLQRFSYSFSLEELDHTSDSEPNPNHYEENTQSS
jgi:hypothetical protein